MIISSHMVWGYVFGKATARFQRTKPNLALLILVGALPDFDLFTREPYGTLLGHHGMSHSWVVIVLISLPFFYVFGARTLPYFVGVLQHPMFGDLVANHIPLLFPLTLSEAGLNLSENNPTVEIALEIIGFLLFLMLFISSGDWKMQLPRTKWTRLWLLLWVPPLLLTAAQGFLYYEPNLLTQIYSAYAIVSSLSLLITCATLAIRTVR